MKILVIGGTGKVGQLLVPMLLERGVDVRVLCRSRERANALPRRAEARIGDLFGAPEATASSFEDVDAVFMLNQPRPEEVAEGLFAVDFAKKHGVRRFVYQSVYRAADLAFLPHVASKVAIGNAVKNSEMDWTLICPNHFYQNDLTARAGIERGLYIQPIGLLGVSGVDARDIAEAAAIALTTDGHSGQDYPLVGPDILTGEDCAALWARTLRRPIAYVGDVDVWQAGVRPYMPAWFNHDLGMMYWHFQANGFSAEAGEVERLTALLGHPPRSYADYVAEQASSWSLPVDAVTASI